MSILTHPDACEPWGYVAPGVAAVMTRATGVRHIYLINLSKPSEARLDGLWGPDPVF